MRRVLAGERGPLWIIAARQTAGRGRSGRAWTSQPGNLFASFVIDARLPARQGRAAVARRRRRRHRRDPRAREAFPACASSGRTTFSSARRRRAAFWLKAPRGRRSAGTIAVIGVGLNLVSAPDDLGRAATFLAQHGLALSPREALCFLAQTMSDWIGIWDDGAGFRARARGVARTRRRRSASR